MASRVKRGKHGFTDGLIGYLQEIDYRLASSNEEKERIYKFRYFSYLREKSIISNPEERFSDDYVSNGQLLEFFDRSPK